MSHAPNSRLLPPSRNSVDRRRRQLILGAKCHTALLRSTLGAEKSHGLRGNTNAVPRRKHSRETRASLGVENRLGRNPLAERHADLFQKKQTESLLEKLHKKAPLARIPGPQEELPCSTVSAMQPASLTKPHCCPTFPPTLLHGLRRGRVCCRLGFARKTADRLVCCFASTDFLAKLDSRNITRNSRDPKHPSDSKVSPPQSKRLPTASQQASNRRKFIAGL